MAGFLDLLGNLGGIAGGYQSMQERLQQQQYQQALMAMNAQNFLQRQQALTAAGQGLQNLFSQPVPQAPTSGGPLFPHWGFGSGFQTPSFDFGTGTGGGGAQPQAPIPSLGVGGFTTTPPAGGFAGAPGGFGSGLPSVPSLGGGGFTSSPQAGTSTGLPNLAGGQQPPATDLASPQFPTWPDPYALALQSLTPPASATAAIPPPASATAAIPPPASATAAIPPPASAGADLSGAPFSAPLPSQAQLPPLDPSILQTLRNAGVPTDAIQQQTAPSGDMTGPQAGDTAQMNVATFGPASSQPLSTAIQGGGLDQVVNSLIQQEGGSPSGVVNNPGNIKYVGSPGQINSGVAARDGGTYASYPSPEAGRQAIAGIVTRAASGQSQAYGASPTVARFIAVYQGRGGIAQTNAAQKQSGIPSASADAATQVAATAFPSIAELEQGQLNRLHTLMDAIDKGSPNASPAVKFLALQQLNALLAPDDKMLLQYMMRMNLAELRGQTGGQVFDVGGQLVRVPPGSNQAIPITTAQGAPMTGATRPGQTQTQAAAAARTKEIQDRIDARQAQAQKIATQKGDAQTKYRATADLYNQTESDIRNYMTANPQATALSDPTLAELQRRAQGLMQMMQRYSGVPPTQSGDTQADDTEVDEP